jgi:hypothetical protein
MRAVLSIRHSTLKRCSALAATHQRVPHMHAHALHSTDTLTLTHTHAARSFSRQASRRKGGKRHAWIDAAAPTLLLSPSSSPSLNPNAVKTPYLSATLKKVYLKVHPDLLHAFPTARANNDESLKVVMDFLQDIKSADPDTPYPAAVNHHLKFYVKKEVCSVV